MKKIIQALKENNCQPRLVYPAKPSFLIDGETKTFHRRLKTKGICNLQASTTEKKSKGLLHTEEETRVGQMDSRKNKPF
jgi:hypothetical protein